MPKLPGEGLPWRRFVKKHFLIVLLGMVLGCGLEKPAPDLFELPVTYPVGKKPAAVIAYDMNRDGYHDLLVTNSGDNTLNYLEGIGNGTFKDPLSLSTGREPVAMDVGDFNGDGTPDIAICNYGDGDVSIILGQKDGLFKLKANVKVGRLPIAIATGDFNNDEKIDLAVTLRFDKMIILLGVGDGTFKLAEAYKASGTPANMAAGDYNGDHNLDLAIAFNAMKVNFIRIFFGNGDGTFQNPKQVKGGHQSSFITQYDINKDGVLDLITSSTMKDSVTLYLGNGKGSFRAVQDVAGEKGPEHIVAGEFTSDRIPDLVVCNRRDNSISILEGKGDGTFVWPHFNYPVGRNPRAITGADFNRDGLTDLAILLYDSQMLEVLMRKIDLPTQTGS
ncbi:MAG: FG-GAP repeat domain-containing protein [Nitrospinaceae bacterium]